MFKSVFSKYISIFIAIIFTGFFILTLVITYLVSNFSAREKYDNLKYIADSVAYFAVNGDETAESGVLTTNLETRLEFNRIVNILSNELDELTVFVTDTTGGVILFKNSDCASEGDIFGIDNGRNAGISSDKLDLLKGGKSIEDMGTLDGILSEHRATVGVPVFYSGQFCGAVFASTVDTKAGDISQSMMMTLIMASLSIMLACMIALYIISARLTKPLREMSIAAKEFSKGNFDVTIPVKGHDEISELATAFNDMAESLRNLDYMRSSFVSNVSHELRTPMTTIGGFIDSIIEGIIPPEEEKHYLEIISKEVKRLSRLVTSLLEISRMESGQQKLNFSVFDVCEMARLILISNEQRLEAKNLDVSYECEKDHIFVKADRDAIYRVIFNICDNAVKFSRDGGKYSISLTVKGEKVEVSVFNEGVGINEEDLPFVFDRFYKSDKSRGLDKSGVGLGLFLVKSIVNSHGEDIYAESESGKWCRFVFTLPISKEEMKNDGRI